MLGYDEAVFWVLLVPRLRFWALKMDVDFDSEGRAGGIFSESLVEEDVKHILQIMRGEVGKSDDLVGAVRNITEERREEAEAMGKDGCGDISKVRWDAICYGTAQLTVLISGVLYVSLAAISRDLQSSGTECISTFSM